LFLFLFFPFLFYSRLDLPGESLALLKVDAAAEWWLEALAANDWNRYRSDPELYRALKARCREGRNAGVS
jgi:hypothetical protein